MNPFLVVRATIARHRGTYALFIALVAVATAIGVAITTQEAPLRIGSARPTNSIWWWRGPAATLIVATVPDFMLSRSIVENLTAQ